MVCDPRVVQDFRLFRDWKELISIVFNSVENSSYCLNEIALLGKVFLLKKSKIVPSTKSSAVIVVRLVVNISWSHGITTSIQ